MALAVVYSRALAAMDAPPVTVEAHLGGGLPNFTIVGLPEAEVKEARDRVRAALQTARFEFPARRITVNLAPADLPKDSGRFDLPIALGILAASGQIPAAPLNDCEFVGELALTGALRPIRGALPMALSARDSGRSLVLPSANAAEAALARGTRILGVESLLQLCAHLTGREVIEPFLQETSIASATLPDLADVKGQMHARRALEVAAAGAHSLLMVGPPGTGKSMLAARLPGIVPPMSEAEALESAAMQSLGGNGFRMAQWGVRPFRAPHHTASAIALVGGGSQPRPGEISLAMHGVLFLDELPEFDRRVLEALREPLDSGQITVSRAARQADFPARFQLVGAMNPCPCGYLGEGRCRCTPDQISRYRARISGPLLDRIDIQIEVPAIAPEELHKRGGGESSQDIRMRVEAARARMLARRGKPNAMLEAREVEEDCALDAHGSRTLQRAIVHLNLSARSYHRLLKVSRSIADLAGARDIDGDHVAEALGYRRKLE
ncbi:MAG: YifB family Mg chelatase-like AAA ATPase [Burkholderiales bacterium]|nr:YifB family Mg chelatase-like AAA ATPase [Burkholderiales bacterium]